MFTTLIANHPGPGYGPGHGYGYDGPPWFVVVLFVAALVAVGVALWRYTRQRSSSSAYGAQAALADRFAKGEIDEDEYRGRLRVLDETGR